MSTPFRSYRALARELMQLAAANQAGGELDSIVGFHEDPAVADWFDPDDARTAAHRRGRLRDAMVLVINEDQERHIEPPLYQSVTVAEVFVFAFRDDTTRTPARRDALARFRLLPQLRGHLSEMEDTDFERLCALLIEGIGCDRVAVTRENKDRGIDFLGRLPVGVGPAARRMALGELHIVIVGQAKRYAATNPVGPEEVRQIVGTWQITMTARGNGELPQHLAEIVDGLGVRSEDPALHMVVTSGFFTGPALLEGRSGGVVLIDGDQLAFALAESRIGVRHVAEAEWRTGADVLREDCARVA